MRRFLLSWLWLFTLMANAHDPRPIYIEVVEQAPGAVTISWRAPPTLAPGQIPLIEASPNCMENDSIGFGRGKQYQCDSPSLPRTLSLSFTETNPSISALVRIEPLNFPARFVHAGPDERVINIPLEGTRNNIWREYFELGLMHIIVAADHILFVVCVVVLAGVWQRIVLTVTGFTLAHSLTLAASSLGFVSVAIAPVEALIALSIMFVAAELLRERRDTLSWRYPALVSATFGLLHGLGFASALKEVGLPETSQFNALLSFNLGVEAGQLVVVFIALTLIWLIKRLAPVALPYVNPGIGWVVGILSAVWFYQRIL